MILAPDDPRYDRVRVERIADGQWPDGGIESTAERDAVIRLMLARGRHITDVIRALHMGYTRGAALIRCVLDERAWELVLGGRCDSCRSRAQWRITAPAGHCREYCSVHGAEALDRLDRAGVPVGAL